MRALAILQGDTIANVILAARAADWPGAVDVTDVSPRPGPGWTRAGDTWQPPSGSDAPADRRITRLAFRNRFTQAELVALEIASLDNPAATMQARQQAASLRVMLANLQAASWIDLQRPDTRTGVQQLEAAGLLGAGRALEILDAPIADIERPAA